MSQVLEIEKLLRKMILDLELGPGERLTERWAESWFGVSRTPVRSALLKLESEGLVCRDGRRWMVAPINIMEVEQLCEYREVLEVAAIRLAAGRIKKDALETLRTLPTHGKTTSDGSTGEAGTEFHLRLAALSGNVFITSSLEDVLRRLSRVRWLDNSADNPAWQEHLFIVDALQKQDISGTVDLLTQHLQDSRERLLAAINASRRSLRASGIAVS